MRTPLFTRGLFGIALGLAIVAGVSAAEPPHLELVRGLRTQGLPDLALEYLDLLQKNGDKAIVAVLPLEYARTRLELASLETDEAKRSALINRARGEIDGFLANNANHPMAPFAQVERARLLSLQGKGILTQARRVSDSKERSRALLASAQPVFDSAAKAYELLPKMIDSRLAALAKDETPAGKALAADLVRTKYQAELDRGINLFNLGETFVDDVIKRGEWINKAKAVFLAMGDKDDTQPACFIAKAWANDCDWELENKRDEARKNLEGLVVASKSPAAAAGSRTARAFLTKYAFSEIGGGPGKTFEAARLRAEAWLRDYSAYRNSAEGLIVRFLLAYQYEQEGLRQGTDKAGKFLAVPVALQSLRAAENLYKDILETDNEFTDRATRRRMNLILLRVDAVNKGKDPDPATLKNFEETWLQAQVQQARLNDFVIKDKPDAAKIKAETLRRWGVVVAVLERGLTLLAPTDSPRDVYDARVTLAYGYARTGDPYRAAVLGDYLARSDPKNRLAPSVASLSINESISIMNAFNKTENLSKEDKAADIARIRSLGGFMEDKFPAENATDAVRYVLAFLYRVDLNREEALKTLMRVTPSFAGVAQARYEQGGVLYSLLRPQGVSDPKVLQDIVGANIKARQAEWNATVAGLEGLAAPSATAENEELDSWVNAKVVLGQLLQLEGRQFDKIVALGTEMIPVVEKNTAASDSTKANQLYRARTTRLQGIYAQAYAQLAQANYAKTAEILDPVLKEITAELEKPQPAEPPLSFDAYRAAQRQVIVSAMRAAVQDGKIDRANELLSSLQKSDKSSDGSMTVLKSMVASVRTQIDLLKRDKKVDEAKKLSTSFTSFLENIAKQPSPSSAMLSFLAQGYAGIDEHAEAAKLYEKILAAPPRTAPDPKIKGDEEEVKKEKELTDSNRKFVQTTEYLLAREYRLGKKFAEAEKLLKKIIGDAKAKGWGFSSIEARKESFFLLEDQKKWRDAVNAWSQYANAFGQNLPPAGPGGTDKDARKRSIYFDLYYETQRCSARAYAASLNDPKNREKAVDGLAKVAQKFVDLEKNPDLQPDLKERVKDLMDEIPDMGKKYRELGGKLVNDGKP